MKIDEEKWKKEGHNIKCSLLIWKKFSQKRIKRNLKTGLGMIFFKKDSTGFSTIRKGNWKTIKFEEILPFMEIKHIFQERIIILLKKRNNISFHLRKML